MSLKRKTARKFFLNVYEYVLYNDYECFMDTLDYRMNLEEPKKAREVYHVFKFMLGHLKNSNPQKLLTLCPLKPDETNKNYLAQT